jgi:hypothetical protein
VADRDSRALPDFPRHGEGHSGLAMTSRAMCLLGVVAAGVGAFGGPLESVPDRDMLLRWVCPKSRCKASHF